MVRVDEILVVEVERSRLVRNVQRMLKRHVPHGERLELRVSCLKSTPAFVVELGKARCKLAGARSGRGHNYDRTLGRHVFVLAVAVLRDDRLHIGRITLCYVVVPHVDTAMLETRAELLGGKLPGIARDDDAAHQKAQRLQVVDELQGVVGV